MDHRRGLLLVAFLAAACCYPRTARAQPLHNSRSEALRAGRSGDLREAPWAPRHSARRALGSGGAVVFAEADRPYTPCGVSGRFNSSVGFQGSFESVRAGFQVQGTLAVYDDCHVAIGKLQYSGNSGASLSLCGGQAGEALDTLGSLLSPGPLPLPGSPAQLVVVRTGSMGLTWDNLQVLYLCAAPAPAAASAAAGQPQAGGSTLEAYAKLELPRRDGAMTTPAQRQRVLDLGPTILAAAREAGVLASPPPPAPPPPPPLASPPPPPPMFLVKDPSKGLENCMAAVPGKINIYWNVRAAPGQVLPRRQGNASSAFSGVMLYEVEFGLEAKVGEDTWLGLGVSANQSAAQMRNADATVAGFMSATMLAAANHSSGDYGTGATNAGAASGSGAGYAVDFFINALQPCVGVAGGYAGVCPDSLLAGSPAVNNVRLTMAARQGDVTFVRFLRNSSSLDHSYDVDLIPASRPSGSLPQGPYGAASTAPQRNSTSRGTWLIFATGPLAPGSTPQVPVVLGHDDALGFLHGGLLLDLLSPGPKGGAAGACQPLWGSKPTPHPVLPPFTPPPPPGAPGTAPSAASNTIQPFSPCTTVVAGQAESFSACSVLPGGFFFLWTLSNSSLSAVLVATSVAAVGPNPQAAQSGEPSVAQSMPEVRAYAGIGFGPIGGRIPSQDPSADGVNANRSSGLGLAELGQVPGSSLLVANILVPRGSAGWSSSSSPASGSPPSVEVFQHQVPLKGAPSLAGAAENSSGRASGGASPPADAKTLLQVVNASATYEAGAIVLKFELALTAGQLDAVNRSVLVWTKGSKTGSAVVTAAAPAADPEAAPAPSASSAGSGVQYGPAPALSPDDFRQLWASTVNLRNGSSAGVNATGVATMAPPRPPSSGLKVHGALAVAAWGFLLPLGILCARLLGKTNAFYQRQHLPKGHGELNLHGKAMAPSALLQRVHGSRAVSLAVHRGLQTLGAGLAISAFSTGLGLDQYYNTPSSAASTCHFVLGSLITLLLVGQVVGSVWRPDRRQAQGTGERAGGGAWARWHRVHMSLGWAGALLALGQVFLGLYLARASTALFAAWAAWLGLLLAAFLAVEICTGVPQWSFRRNNGSTSSKEVAGAAPCHEALGNRDAKASGSDSKPSGGMDRPDSRHSDSVSTSSPGSGWKLGGVSLLGPLRTVCEEESCNSMTRDRNSSGADALRASKAQEHQQRASLIAQHQAQAQAQERAGVEEPADEGQAASLLHAAGSGEEAGEDASGDLFAPRCCPVGLGGGTWTRAYATVEAGGSSMEGRSRLESQQRHEHRPEGTGPAVTKADDAGPMDADSMSASEAAPRHVQARASSGLGTAASAANLGWRETEVASSSAHQAAGHRDSEHADHKSQKMAGGEAAGGAVREAGEETQGKALPGPSSSGLAAGVEARVVVESREEANRRRFALLSSALRQEPAIEVDKYNVKATVMVPSDFETLKASLLQQQAQLHRQVMPTAAVHQPSSGSLVLPAQISSDHALEK